MFYSGHISAVGWLDLNHDGWLDVAATMSFSSEIWHTPPTEDGCAHEAELMSDRLESTATRSLLEFINTGTDFRPSPSTQQVLADIEAKTRYRPQPRTPAPSPSRKKPRGAGASGPRPTQLLSTPRAADLVRVIKV